MHVQSTCDEYSSTLCPELIGMGQAAARCEELIGKEMGMFDNRSGLLVPFDGDPDKMSPAMLEKIAERLLKHG